MPQAGSVRAVSGPATARCQSYTSGAGMRAGQRVVSPRTKKGLWKVLMKEKNAVELGVSKTIAKDNR